jgi:hypothetical protein
MKSTLRNILQRVLDYCVGTVLEVLSIFTAILASLFAFRNENPKSLRSSAPGTIKRVTILVHGFLHNRTAWIYLRPQLESKPEVGTLFTLNLGSPFQSIESYAEILRRQLSEIKKMAPDDLLEVNLVGHSMGGLVSLHYAVENLEWNVQNGIQVVNIVTLASPLQGTPVAHLASWCCPCAKEMLPGSNFLRNLHKKANKLSVIPFSIGCGTDFIVSPKRSFLEGSQNVHEIPYMGHMTLLYSKRIVGCILEGILMKPRPS